VALPSNHIDEGRDMTEQAGDGTPRWTLRDCRALDEKNGPRVVLSVAEGWPLASLPADHADELGRQLIEAAKQARATPPHS
jgi:hypothetical protein